MSLPLSPSDTGPFQNQASATALPPPDLSGGAFGMTTGSYASGIQPGGNNYPVGIYGAGGNGAGTALGTLQPGELTSNRLAGLLDENSPYIKQARQQAEQQANSRGAYNSSIAAGNAQGAAIQAALPIASQDAQAEYGLQTTNLNNLSKIQGANIGANAQMTSAATAAAASMYDTNANNAGALLRQQDNLAYQGEQAGLNYQRQLGLQQQGFYDTSAENQQQFQNSASLDQYNRMFDLGGNLLLGNQSFMDSLGLKAIDNPALSGNPEALGGYGQFIYGPFSNYIDSIFGGLSGFFDAPPSQGNAQPASGG